MESKVNLVIVLSGKRKCGKDFFSEKLAECFAENTFDVRRLSAPLKKAYAEENDLDFQELLSDSNYKEKYRKDMVDWSDTKRRQDPWYFCKLATRDLEKPILIVPDARRKNDLLFFKQEFGSRLVTVRINASEKTRISRGWNFTPGIDDKETECGLDDISDWNWVLQNEGNAFEELLTEITAYASSI